MATCDVAERGCLAPAGYRTSKGVAQAPGVKRLPTCYRCGSNICAACARTIRVDVVVMRVNGGHTSKRRVLVCPPCAKEASRP